MCRTAEGCPVPDAPDPIINDFISRFRLARTLFEINKIPSMYENALKDLGLYDEPLFLMEMECIFSTWKERQNKKEKESNWNDQVT